MMRWGSASCAPLTLTLHTKPTHRKTRDAWATVGSQVRGSGTPKALMSQWLNNDVVRVADRIWRTWSPAMQCRSNGKDEQLARVVTDGIQMVIVVPEHLI